MFPSKMYLIFISVYDYLRWDYYIMGPELTTQDLGLLTLLPAVTDADFTAEGVKV